jgi:predicted XRE-type DNA-binding protein
MNVTQAAIRIGASPKSALNVGNGILAKDGVKARLYEQMKNRLQQIDISSSFVLSELIRIYQAKINSLQNEAGDIGEMSQADEKSLINMLNQIGKHTNVSAWASEDKTVTVHHVLGDRLKAGLERNSNVIDITPNSGQTSGDSSDLKQLGNS